MIGWFHATVAGLVQGLTEFLPISSSAHLVLLPKLMRWPDQGLAFDAAANTGTLVALIVFFRRLLLDLLVGLTAELPRRLRQPGADLAPTERLTLELVLATVPVGVAGYLLQDWIAHSAREIAIVATTTLVFGIALGWADRQVGPADATDSASEEHGGNGSADEEPRPEAVGLGRAVAIGLAQAIALVPGTSRSGITMTVGLLTGLSREQAARFSFLLAIPVGLLVAVKDVLDVISGKVELEAVAGLLIVLAVSAISGYVAMVVLLRWLRRRSFAPFVLYRLVLGVVLLLFLLRS